VRYEAVINSSVFPLSLLNSIIRLLTMVVADKTGRKGQECQYKLIVFDRALWNQAMSQYIASNELEHLLTQTVSFDDNLIKARASPDRSRHK